MCYWVSVRALLKKNLPVVQFQTKHIFENLLVFRPFGVKETPPKAAVSRVSNRISNQ